MNPKTLSLTISILALLLVAASVAAYFMTAAADRQAHEAHELRYRSYLLADELRQTSDDLTRMARTYVVTGDDRFAEHFQRILDIRNGIAPRPIDYNGIYWDLITDSGQPPRGSTDAVALRALMQQAGFTAEEIAWLQRSEDESNTLVELETRAMNAMVGLYQDAAGAYSVRDEPDRQTAIDLLHGSEYHREKALIMSPLNELFAELDARTAAAIEQQRARAAMLRGVTAITLGIAALLLIASIALAVRDRRAP